MSAILNNLIWQACEVLAKEKHLITIKNIRTKLTELGYQNHELDCADHELTAIINKWRITKLNNQCVKTENDADTFNIYKALAIPRKEDKTTLSNMQKKIFSLEYELNKYKHAACRANQKTKLLEKKLHTVVNNAQRERQEVIAKIKNMLTNP